MAIRCKDPAEYFPVITVSETLVAGSVTTGSSVYDTDLQFTQTVTTSGHVEYDIALSEPRFQDNYTLENMTPSICTLAGGKVSRVTNGSAVIRVSKGTGVFRDLTYSMTTRSTSASTWTGYSGTTVASTLHSSILDLLVGGKGLNYYTGYANNSTATARNADCWGAGLDLSALPFATDLFAPTWTAANSGAAITTRHVVGVQHWLNGAKTNMGVGRKYRFAEQNGTMSERTVIGRHQVPNSDIQICVLDSAIPASITPMAIVGPWFSKYVSGSPRFLGSGFTVDQTKSLHAISFDSVYGARQAEEETSGIRVISWYNGYLPSDAASPFYGKSAFLGGGTVGDSGGFVGGLLGGAPFIVSLFTGPTSGQLMQSALLNTYIASADADAGVSTGLTVTVAPDPTL